MSHYCKGQWITLRPDQNASLRECIREDFTPVSSSSRSLMAYDHCSEALWSSFSCNLFSTWQLQLLYLWDFHSSNIPKFPNFRSLKRYFRSLRIHFASNAAFGRRKCLVFPIASQQTLKDLKRDDREYWIGSGSGRQNHA